MTRPTPTVRVISEASFVDFVKDDYAQIAGAEKSKFHKDWLAARPTIASTVRIINQPTELHIVGTPPSLTTMSRQMLETSPFLAIDPSNGMIVLTAENMRLSYRVLEEDGNGTMLCSLISSTPGSAQTKETDIGLPLSIEAVYPSGIPAFDYSGITESRLEHVGDTVVQTMSDGKRTTTIVYRKAEKDIDASKIIVGRTTLESWRSGSDSTKIAGGSIETASIISKLKIPTASYRKKPVVIEAVQFPPLEETFLCPNWLTAAFIAGTAFWQGGEAPYVTLVTLEGEMRAGVGDWIIRGVKGELYPCRNDIFEMTYEAVA